MKVGELIQSLQKLEKTLPEAEIYFTSDIRGEQFETDLQCFNIDEEDNSIEMLFMPYLQNDVLMEGCMNDNKKATLVASTGYGMTFVTLYNCSDKVVSLMSMFAVHQGVSGIEYHCSGEERPYFLCPLELLDFIDSSLGRTLFERVGVECISVKRKKTFKR